MTTTKRSPLEWASRLEVASRSLWVDLSTDDAREVAMWLRTLVLDLEASRQAYARLAGEMTR